jgi:cyclophilin family peptidyl-prolyl cis-trans isomerase
MANGSQFFIAPRGADLTKLTGYPVIGKVTRGFAVVDTIEKVAIDENYRPINDISINSILIIEE